MWMQIRLGLAATVKTVPWPRSHARISFCFLTGQADQHLHSCTHRTHQADLSLNTFKGESRRKWREEERRNGEEMAVSGDAGQSGQSWSLIKGEEEMVYVPRQDDVGLELQVECIPGSQGGPQGLWFGQSFSCPVRRVPSEVSNHFCRHICTFE